MSIAGVIASEGGWRVWGPALEVVPAIIVLAIQRRRWRPRIAAAT
jgi:hypothetical protein